jgi:hypothetical protein
VASLGKEEFRGVSFEVGSPGGRNTRHPDEVDHLGSHLLNPPHLLGRGVIQGIGNRPYTPRMVSPDSLKPLGKSQRENSIDSISLILTRPRFDPTDGQSKFLGDEVWRNARVDRKERPGGVMLFETARMALDIEQEGSLIGSQLDGHKILPPVRS